MTAAELLKLNRITTEIDPEQPGHKPELLGYYFDVDGMQQFIDHVCREQLQKAADEYFDLCREYQDEVHNAILTAPKPDGL